MRRGSCYIFTVGAPVDCQTFAVVMPSLSSFPQLHNLDRSSPEFPSRLTDILLGEDFKNRVQSPPRDELGPLVEYLDGVRLRIPLARPLLNITVGPQQP